MIHMYEYLREFLPPRPPYDGTNRNWFCPLNPDDVVKAEKLLGFPFPSQLRQFYEEIGYGSLCAPHNIEKGYTAFMVNQIFSPSVAAIFYKPLMGDNRPEEGEDYLSTGDEGYYMSAMAYEMLQPGDLPFFEIGDSTRFLVMRPHSDTPNAVWSYTGVKIEDSFEKFIWRLYYEDPAYYDDIITAYYKDIRA